MNKDVIEIMDLSKEYLASVCILANRAFGDGYFTEERYLELASKEGCFSVALYNGNFAGFCFLIHEKTEETAENLKLDVSQIKPYADARGLVCHAKSIVVDPKFRRNNLTDRLFAETLKKSREAGMRSVWVAAWKYDGKVPAKRTLAANGFSFLAEKELMWFDDKQYKCIVCDGACRCNGVVYYKIWEKS